MIHQRPHAVLDRPSEAVRTTVRSLRWASVVGGLSQSLAAAAGALLVREVTDRASAAGWPQAALVVGAAGAAVVLTRLTRTHGRRLALATGAVAAAFGSLVVVVGAVSGSLPVILVGSVLLGSGNTTVMLGRYAAGELFAPTARARQMGWVLAATAVGAVAGPTLLGPSGAVAELLRLPAHAGAYLVALAGNATTACVLLLGMRALPARAPEPAVQPRPRTTVRRSVLAPEGVGAVTVLGAANLVMVAVMTMAPLHLHQHGAHLDAIGLVVGVHVAGMFLPSPVTGWLTDRVGPRPVVALAGVLLAVACLTVTWGTRSSTVLVGGLILLGIGWNAALVAGSAWLTSASDGAGRTSPEAAGEVAMGVAAAVGALLAGLVVDAFGYAALATAAAALSVGLVPLGWSRGRSSGLQAAEHPPEPSTAPRLAQHTAP